MPGWTTDGESGYATSWLLLQYQDTDVEAVKQLYKERIDFKILSKSSEPQGRARFLMARLSQSEKERC